MLKNRRQIEIISFIQDSRTPVSVADICKHFDVEVATAQRDLRELREQGIQVHSTRGSIKILNHLSNEELQRLLSAYISSAATVVSFPKNISLTVKKLGQKSLRTFITLVHAIEKRQVIELTYYKIFNDEQVIRVVEPYDIIPTNTNWRLIARSDGLFKQFIVENIEAIRTLDRHFSRSREYDPNKLFRGSFDYWSGEERIEVVLKFSKRVAPIIKNTVWSEDEETETLRDGSVILRMKVNSLENFGNWVMSWGGNVKVVRPGKLRTYLMKVAKAFTQANRN